MSPLKWLLLTVGAVAIVGYVVWWYRTREDEIRGRGWAAGLRAAALLLVWLILINPALPAGESGPRQSEVALVDASYSMSRLDSPGGAPAWKAALDSARRFDAVWLFGGPVPSYFPADSLPDGPLHDESQLAPALRAAAAAGAERVVVYTDGAITDAGESAELAQRHGLTLRLASLTRPYPEIGIAGVSGSSWVQSGDTAQVRAEIVATSFEGDSVRVEVVDEDGRVRSAAWATVPEDGRYTPVRLAFRVTGQAGYRRFVVRLSTVPPDPEDRNDHRAFYIRVSEEPVGPVLISLRPDWEPSFLIPNLDRLTDAPTAAYLWLTDSLVTLDGYRRVSLDVVQRRARQAPLLVVHGYGADVPDWTRALVQSASRLLVFPGARRAFTLADWGIRVSVPAAGEWYAAQDVPQSPLALDLSRVPVDALPPLLNVRSIEAERAWAPLQLQRLRRGEPLPAVLAGRSGTRRWAVAAGSGYWRWAFRAGPGRQLYRSLWTGLAGWLMEGRARADAGLEPLQRVVTWGQPLRWRAPADADSLSVTLEAIDADSSWTGVAAPGDSLAALLPPARYRYVARAYRDERLVASAEGPAEIEEFSHELLPLIGPSLEATVAGIPGDDPSRADRGTRPLAALGWPYLVLIVLFCAEWTVRRFGGLR